MVVCCIRYRLHTAYAKGNSPHPDNGGDKVRIHCGLLSSSSAKALGQAHSKIRATSYMDKGYGRFAERQLPSRGPSYQVYRQPLNVDHFKVGIPRQINS